MELLGKENLKIKNIVFDLDGTLIDSFPAILQSLQHAVSKLNPTLDLSGLKNHIGPPLLNMLSAMWPYLPRKEMDQVLQEFRQDYNSRGCLLSVAYPGIREALHRFYSLGIKMFVLTNKPEIPTRKILKHLVLEGYFSEILSPDSMTSVFATKSEAALYLIEKHALIPQETVLMGDSLDDLNAARTAGMNFLEAAYGYGKLEGSITKGGRYSLKDSTKISDILKYT